MCATANGLLGLIAQNQFDDQRGDQTLAELEQLLRKIETQLGSAQTKMKTDDDKDHSEHMTWQQVQQDFKQQMQQFKSAETGSAARREEMLRIAAWAEKKSAWPEGLLQKVAVEASRKLGQGFPKSRKKKAKTSRQKNR